MKKILDFFKNNVVYVIVIVLLVAFFGLLIPCIFIDMFKVSYTDVNDAIIRVDYLSLSYTFAHLEDWFTNGSKAENEMFIQYTFIILCAFGFAFVCLVVSFVLNFLKEKMSAKFEFISGAFAIAAAITSFAIMLLLVIMVTSLEMKPKLFPHKAATIELLAGYGLLFLPALFALFSGALLTANSSERNI